MVSVLDEGVSSLMPSSTSDREDELLGKQVKILVGNYIDL